MDRYWLITSTTYGTWLPGDKRGFVGFLDEDSTGRVIHNSPGEPYDADRPALIATTQAAMRAGAIYFQLEHAQTLLAQFQETAEHRGWLLMAVAIMTWHFHLVVGVPGDPDPESILRDFKAYGSRALNRKFGRPASETWWTESGSKRKLKAKANVTGAVRYVEQQESPLVVWLNPLCTSPASRTA